MKALLVSDIHSNLEAFRVVLEDAARRGGFDEVWCMGDIVGYGADPNECIEMMRSHSWTAVAGNHDLAATGRLSTRDFNYTAAFAAQWTAARLTPDNAAFLTSLPEVAMKGDFTIVHGTLRSPVVEYLVSAESAAENFRLMETRFCLVGHSHLPFVCQETDAGPEFEALPLDSPVKLGSGRLVINPGGVGQPRDGDPRTAYAIYDGDLATIRAFRLEYDIGTTQDKIRSAGLPDRLAQRLEVGF